MPAFPFGSNNVTVNITRMWSFSRSSSVGNVNTDLGNNSSVLNNLCLLQQSHRYFSPFSRIRIRKKCVTIAVRIRIYDNTIHRHKKWVSKFEYSLSGRLIACRYVFGAVSVSLSISCLRLLCTSGEGKVSTAAFDKSGKIFRHYLLRLKKLYLT